MSPAEQAGIASGLRSSDAFTRRARVRPCAMRSKPSSRRAWSVSSKSLPGQKPCKRILTRLAAEVCFAQGVTKSQVSIETLRQALKRLGVAASPYISSEERMSLTGVSPVTPMRRGCVAAPRHFVRCLIVRGLAPLTPTRSYNGSVVGMTGASLSLRYTEAWQATPWPREERSDRACPCHGPHPLCRL